MLGLQIVGDKIEMEYKKTREAIILAKGYFKDYKFAVVSYGKYPCAYVTIPKDHALYMNVEDASYIIRCHGGVSYSGVTSYMEGWAVGWDYNHYNDYDAECYEYGFKYTTEKLLEHVQEVIEQLRELEHKDIKIYSYEAVNMLIAKDMGVDISQISILDYSFGARVVVTEKKEEDVK